MEPLAEPRNTTLREMRWEVVTKDDGRYLIYYSWPDEDEQAESTPGERDPAHRRPAQERPAQQPWSPETGASDV
jgi:hypothetical protein